jgi:type IV pilus assembly protein PilB
MSKEDFFIQLKNEIGKICLDQHLLSSEQFDVISKHAKNTEGNLYDLILKDGHATEEKLLKALEDKYGIPAVYAAKPVIPNFKNFPYQFCFKSGLIPIGDDGVTLEIGVCAPSCLNSIKNLNLLTGRKVAAKFIGASVLMYAIRSFDEATNSFIDRRGTKNASGGLVNAVPVNEDQLVISVSENKKIEVSHAPTYQRRKSDKKDLILLSGDVVTGVENILSHAVNNGCSDIHFEIFKDTANVRFRKNGRLVSIPEYVKFISDNYNAVIARIKILSNLDIAERRLPQDGKISFKAEGGTEVDFRVSVLPTNLGERVVVRILNSSTLAISIDALGFNPRQKNDFLEAIGAPQGLVLVTGPTGSGKSTTLYGAIHYLNKPDVNILTAEDPVEYTMSGISQVQVREDIGLGFAEALRSFLRQDPEIILVGEIRDTETADIATKAALTGHLVLSTLHTNSAVGAINRLINMGLPPYLVSSALTLVVAQRLVRVNCKHCTTEIDQINDHNSSQLSSFPDLVGKVLKQGQGCEQCSQTGYSGRMAVHEVLKITPRIQKAMNELATENDIVAIAKQEGFMPMADTALEHVKSGILSLEEYVRVIPHYVEAAL